MISKIKCIKLLKKKQKVQKNEKKFHIHELAESILKYPHYEILHTNTQVF